MNKALIEVALLALTSAGAMAGKPPKPEPTPNLTPRVDALENAVDNLISVVVGALHFCPQKTYILVSGLESTPIFSPHSWA